MYEEEEFDNLKYDDEYLSGLIMSTDNNNEFYMTDMQESVQICPKNHRLPILTNPERYDVSLLVLHRLLYYPLLSHLGKRKRHSSSLCLEDLCYSTSSVAYHRTHTNEGEWT